MNLKIENWAFDAHKHVEYHSQFKYCKTIPEYAFDVIRYIPYASVESKITSFMNTLNTQLPSPLNNTPAPPPNLPNNVTKNKMNHNTTNETNNEKDHSPGNGEKANITQPAFIDLEDCNGISSPSNDLSTLENLLNDDENNTTANNTTNSYSDNNKSNTNESPNNIEGNSTNNLSSSNNSNNSSNSNSSKSSNKSNSTPPNTDPADVLNFVRTQLQSTFKYNSPVNEYGMWGEGAGRKSGEGEGGERVRVREGEGRA